MYFESLSFPKMLLVNLAKEMAIRLLPSGAVGAKNYKKKGTAETFFSWRSLF